MKDIIMVKSAVSLDEATPVDPEEKFKVKKLTDSKKKWRIGIAVTVGLLAVGGLVAGVVIGTRSTGDDAITDVCTNTNCSRMTDRQSVTSICSVDTGSCSGDVCLDCVGDGEYCCAPTFEQHHTCGDEQVSFHSVFECSCMPCTERKIAVSGWIVGGCEGCQFSINYQKDVLVSATEEFFHFIVNFPAGDRISFTVTDTDGKFFPQVKIVNVSPARQVYANEMVIMTRKPEPQIFSAQEGGEVEPMADSPFSMEFPPNTTFRADGTPYQGNVSVSLDFVNPGNMSEIDRIPGQLVIDVPGQNESVMLSSSGMFQLDITDDEGNQLEARNVEVLLSSDNLEENETSATELLELDEETGSWKRISNLSDVSGNSTLRRNKRSTRNLALLGTTLSVIRARRIFNLDALLRRYCYMKVRIFENDEMSWWNQVSGVRVTSVYLRRNSSAWVNYLTTHTWPQYNSWYGYYYSGGACVQVPCDGLDFTSISKVIVQAPGYHISMPSVDNSILQAVRYQDYDNPFGADDGFTIEVPRYGLPGTSSYYDDTGPFFLSYYGCRTSNGQYFTLVRQLPQPTTPGNSTFPGNLTSTTSGTTTVHTMDMDSTASTESTTGSGDEATNGTGRLP